MVTENNEIKGKDEDVLEDLIGLYGEDRLIIHLCDSVLHKEKRLKEHSEPKKISKKQNAINFALYVENELFEDTFQDFNGDGRTWTCLDDNFTSYDTAKRYTINEIYKSFKNNN